MTSSTLEALRSGGHDGQVRKTLFRKLKPGPGHSAEEVLADQRARLQRALVDLVGEHGYHDVTVRALSRRAAVSTRTFYKHFGNVEECFLASYDSLMECALGHASAARTRDEDWAEGLRNGLRAVMQDLADNPAAGRVALIESFALGPPSLESRSPVREFEQFLSDAFAGAPDRIVVPPPILQGMVAGAARVGRSWLLAGRSAELPGIVDELADWVVSLREGSDVAATADRNVEANGHGAAREGGSFGTPRPGASGNERQCILVAAAKLCVREGYGALTVPRIRAEAGVSRRSFDVHFAGVEACFLEAAEVLTMSAAARAEEKATTVSGWERGVQQACAALCGELAQDPVLAHLGFVEVLAPGRPGMHCRERFVERCADRLQRTAPRTRRPSKLSAEASVAAAWRIVHTEIAAGRRKKLARIAPLVAHVLLAPTRAHRKAAA